MTNLTHTVHTGASALVVSLPHVGTHIPAPLRAAFVPRALELEDTDWHLQRLYDFAASMDVTVIAAHVSRYVIDLNRPPDDAPMYPGAANTELCPTRFFSGESLYRDSCAPSKTEIVARREMYWQPYHDAVRAALDRARAAHGYALLWDGHSIRSEIPWLFEGKLPDLNVGTASEKSCDPKLRSAIVSQLHAQQSFTVAVDARFKGGYITRHHGQPERGVHAIQMEMCQSLYMQEHSPFTYDEARAALVQPLLKDLLTTCLDWTPSART
ncbi:MAG: N-formylglutamate deformylase [Betaproteobacteria bacterium]|nr:MAG: N-formylglutamate deformylase [Betaproteobacteria bacterium]TAG84571.1 MAG: N-formylglutamate deformylase [Betaproteobacteria bacterium]